MGRWSLTKQDRVAAFPGHTHSMRFHRRDSVKRFPIELLLGLCACSTAETSSPVSSSSALHGSTSTTAVSAAIATASSAPLVVSAAATPSASSDSPSEAPMTVAQFLSNPPKDGANATVRGVYVHAYSRSIETRVPGPVTKEELAWTLELSNTNEREQVLVLCTVPKTQT
jgi:hypothetical protein